MKKWRLHYPLTMMCRVLGVARSGFCSRPHRKPSRRGVEDERLKMAIKAAHDRTRKSCGVGRLRPEPIAGGFKAGGDRIIRLRRELNIRCIQKKKFKATTNSEHSLPVAENLLDQNFTPSVPNQVWVTDIAYIPTQEGRLYLAGAKDVFACEIVGYAVADRMSKELVSQALFRAARQKRPAKGLIHHSDRGGRYCAHNYQNLLKRFGVVASMSRKGNCCDNAPMESFWGSLKNELAHHERYEARNKAKASIQEYIEIFYNRQRRHSRPGYISPAAFEANCCKIMEAA